MGEWGAYIVLMYHVRKGTRLSPSLLFAIVVRGESLGMRLGLRDMGEWRKNGERGRIEGGEKWGEGGNGGNGKRE